MSRIWESCVSSEDIKQDCGADYIITSSCPEIDLMIVKKDLLGREAFIGYIENYANILGDDIIIRKIRIYNNDKLTRDLSDKYLGKILILSKCKDKWL